MKQTQPMRQGDGLSPPDPSLLVAPLEFISEDHTRERQICAVIGGMALSASFDRRAAQTVPRFLYVQLNVYMRERGKGSPESGNRASRIVVSQPTLRERAGVALQGKAGLLSHDGRLAQGISASTIAAVRAVKHIRSKCGTAGRQAYGRRQIVSTALSTKAQRLTRHNNRLNSE